MAVHRALLRQLGNLLVYFEGRLLKAEVVVHGQAYPLLSEESAYREEIMSLQGRGVQWLLCANTIRSLSASASWLPGVRIIPAGVGHLVERQLEGWAYLRAGE
ncbi:hypothetical protein CK934_21405 [Chitinophaga sp. MD30]|nr:hypothetical protein CK934_21405 [Chitinophaga sp. MD30]